MLVQCKCNDGFEDVLTVGEMYHVESQGASYRVMNDRGRSCWYGVGKFGIVRGSMV